VCESGVDNPSLVPDYSVRDFSDRRFIAPSRFGHLGSNMPLDATPAHQADALAAVLEALGIDQIDVMESPRLDHFGIERTAPREVAKAVSDYFLR
jgi:hypothetical protein